MLQNMHHLPVLAFAADDFSELRDRYNPVQIGFRFF
jgi:hypothetical protein